MTSTSTRRLLSALLAIAFTACSTPTVPPPAPSLAPAPNTPPVSVTATEARPAAPASPTASGSIVVAGIGQPSHELTSLPRFISDALYDSLLRVDPADGSLRPGLADSWQISDDSRTISFHLRPNLHWHDGEPLTADDAVFTIKTLSDPSRRGTPAADFSRIVEATALDAQTVTIQLDSPYCSALTSLGTLKILPKHILENKDLSALAPKDFIGTGPLILKQWNSDALAFARNADYWNGPPLIVDWTFRIFGSTKDAEAALNQGQVDIAPWNFSPSDAPPPAVSVIGRSSNEFYSLALNNENKILADLRVRQAVAAGLDRSSLSRTVASEGARLLQSSVLNEFWAAPPDASQPGYDPARARTLLTDAGWSSLNGDGFRMKEGQVLRVTLWAEADDPIQESMALAIRDDLAQIGVQAILELDDHYGLLTRLLLHEYDIGLSHWNIPLDPDQHWFWQTDENTPGKGLNISSYSDPQVDELLKQGNTASKCDPAARRASYVALFRTVAQDVPQVFLLAPSTNLAVRSRVRGVQLSSFAGDYWNMNQWQVNP